MVSGFERIHHPKAGQAILKTGRFSDVAPVLYYGIFDEESTFKTAMYYPIFWKRLIDFMTDQTELSSLNK